MPCKQDLVEWDNFHSMGRTLPDHVMASVEWIVLVSIRCMVLVSVRVKVQASDGCFVLVSIGCFDLVLVFSYRLLYGTYGPELFMM